jgi:hypothetical protein
VNRVVGSTRVPIAELFSPRIRSRFPVTGHGPVPGLGRALADHDLKGDELLATAAGAGSRDAQRPPGPQAGGQLPAQGTPALDVEGLVDRLVRDPHGFIIGEVDPEPVRDLLGLHDLAQRRFPVSADRTAGPKSLSGPGRGFYGKTVVTAGPQR